MKYINDNLKSKLFGSIGVAYTIEGAPGHSAKKPGESKNLEFGHFDTKLMCADIIAQNDLIELDFNSDNEMPITVTSEELRAIAKELISWADISDETLL